MPYSSVDLFNMLYDYSVATIWPVREDLIKERAKPYDPNSNRYCHAVLSIQKGRIADNLERIPMLVGRGKSTGKKAIKVRGIFPSYPPEAVTHFGKALVPLAMADFTDAAPDSSGKLTGSLLECKRVILNHHKPKVDHKEKEQLMAWMARRGF